VKRGPIVYCLESSDLTRGKSIFDVAIPADMTFQTENQLIDNCPVTSLTGEAKVIDQQQNWDGVLYRKIDKGIKKTIPLRFVPYFTWGNRGHTDMTVWMPVSY